MIAPTLGLRASEGFYMVVRWMRCRMAGAVTLVAGLVAASACGNGPVTVDSNDAGSGADQASGGASVGQPCDPSRTCRGGLACTAGACAPSHASGDGTPCTISAECKAGDYCGPARTCAPAGTGAESDACKSDADCASGLRCDLVGLGAVCKAEGTNDVGGACATSADCFGGLACVKKACVPLPVSPEGPPPLGIATWAGADCVDDTGPTKAYFRIPRGTGDGDFYRLPYPNDVRLVGGHPSLTNHPTPGADLLGYDLVDRYLRDLEAHADGFSAYPTVTLRFNREIDFNTIKDGSIHWVSIDASGSGTGIGFGWSATTGRNQYVCPNAITARPAEGQPLKSGGTYAFVLSKGIKDTSGNDVAADADLVAMLGATAPSEKALADAWTKYKPLRDWATANGGTTNVIGGTVFTVGHADALAPKLAAAVAAAPEPSAGNWVKCAAGVTSPCPQATGARACGAEDPAFYELHSLATIPIFQQGTKPYLTPDQGGDIAVDASGTPQVQRGEQVCISLTLPKVTMPAAGFPLVIYAHGTGGSFRSQVTDGVAAILAAAKDDAGTPVPIAVLSIDQVEHGTRRGASNDSPNTLFYNFANPLAARGNPLQGAADQASLVRLAKGLAVPASVTGAAASFAGVAFWGHSQGATEGAIAMPYVDGVLGVLLSGEGASLVDALLTKRRPVDIADAIPFALGETAVDVYHPILSMLQNDLDVADPLNHAAALAAHPVKPGSAKHVFQPYGLGDTYSPTITQATYALAASLGLATPPATVAAPDKIGGLAPLPVPASGNLTDGARSITAIVRQYSPSLGAGYDGHFVVFQDPDAKVDAAVYLADVLTGRTPKVGH